MGLFFVFNLSPLISHAHFAFFPSDAEMAKYEHLQRTGQLDRSRWFYRLTANQDPSPALVTSDVTRNEPAINVEPVSSDARA